jgi:hypothetical protein
LRFSASWQDEYGSQRPEFSFITDAKGRKTAAAIDLEKHSLRATVKRESFLCFGYLRTACIARRATSTSILGALWIEPLLPMRIPTMRGPVRRAT